MKQGRVVLSGGFGNQLWQLAFAHKLSTSISVEVIKINKKNSLHGHLEVGANLTERLIAKCEHDLTFKVRNFENIITRGRFIPESNWARFWGKSIIDSRDMNWRMLDKINVKGPRTHLGFFQSLSYLHEEVSIVLGELRDLIEQVSPIISGGLEKNFALIHIRGGDYLHPAHLKVFGALGEDYYLRLSHQLSKLGYKKAIIVTDDRVSALKRLAKVQELDCDIVDDLDEISTLNLMANAAVVCTANSSFSWWGGMLAIMRGSQVYAPKPWFRSVGASTNDHDIYSSSMIKMESKFTD
jgi:hypothetical protein